MDARAWCIYALGGGWGHLNRAMALALAAAQQRPVHLLTNSPYSKIFQSIDDPHGDDNLPARLTLHPLPQASSIETARQVILDRLKCLSYSCLIVDTFPRGLIGELAILLPQQPHICHILIHRDLNPDYVKARDIVRYTTRHYDGILLPGEKDGPLADLPQTYYTNPWISRNVEDLPDQGTCREQFGILLDRPFVLVCATGKPRELQWFGDVMTQLTIAFPSITVKCLAAACPPNCSPRDWLKHWPGIDIVQLADIVVGGGGYNLVQECRVLAIPLVAFAFPRRYDRQCRRIQQHCFGVTTVAEAVETVSRLLAQSSRGNDLVKEPRRLPHYSNGVPKAIQQIEQWVTPECVNGSSPLDKASIDFLDHSDLGHNNFD